MGAKALFVDALYFSRLLVESMGLVTQAIVKRRKAKAAFKKTLVHQGVPPEIAKEIAKEYPNPVNDFFNLVKNSTIG
jgi:hypothetical protein